MSKEIDDNGFWLIEGNPVSREGVFPYLGKTISPRLEPNKVYQVYRPYSELSSPETLKSFDGIPFIEDHEMLGDGFTSTDLRTPQGVLMNTRADSGMIVGDLKIFSDSMKESIRSGKKELSLGYKCNYRLEPGVWNGQHYDAVQTDLRGNHIALVDKGRMGSAVRVYDWAFDALEIENKQPAKESSDMDDPKNKENKPGAPAQDESVDKRKIIDDIGGILKDKVDEEILRTILAKAEKLAYNASEAGKATDEDDPDKNKPKDDPKDKGEDEDGDKPEDKPEDKKGKAEDKCGNDEFYDGSKMLETIERLENEGKISPEAAKTLKGSAKYSRSAEGAASNEEKRQETGAKKSGMDAADVIAEVDRRNALYNQLTAHIGEFAVDGMTEAGVARYACDKLGLKPESDAGAVALVHGYLAGKKTAPAVYGIAADSRIPAPGEKSDRIKRYLKDGK